MEIPHATIDFYRSKTTRQERTHQPLEADWLKNLCREAGADDVGLVRIGRPEIADQVSDIRNALSATQTLISFVRKMNREPIRTPARSVANLEFHHTGDEVNETGRKIVGELEDRGIKAVNPAMGFPMEMDRFPGKIWVISHKPVAVAAGLGHMGIHRNVIHPRFGNFILLGTILMAADVDEEDWPIDYNPCLECKLCVAACPTGAISADGHFNFSACYTHNYREFMGGFTDWVENIADSKSARSYRANVTDAESSSMWQSLSFGANYKAAYCMSVCPAGEDVIGPYLHDKKQFLTDIVKPLQDKEETVYVTKGSDAENHVARRFKSKKVKRVGSGLRPASIQGFLEGLFLTFQRDKSKNRDVTYHFTFFGQENAKATVRIVNRKLDIKTGHHDKADVHVVADAKTWLKFLSRDTNLLWALITRRIRIRGNPLLMKFFANCFPL